MGYIKETVYIVDSDESIREGMAALLSTLNVDTQSYPDGKTFLTAIANDVPDKGCLIIDTDLPGLDNLTLLKLLRDRKFKLPVLVLANAVNQEIAKRSIQAGATDVIAKPLVAENLLKRLQEILP